jgi:DnaJ-class molecular chaperone
MPRQIPCPACQGEGQVFLGEYIVTHEMAMDACEPDMEGMSMGPEYGPCDQCYGSGLVEEWDEL